MSHHASPESPSLGANPEPAQIRSELQRTARAGGFLRLAIAPAEDLAEDREAARRRIREGEFSGLPWFTEERVERASDPRRLVPDARSVIVLAATYDPVEAPPAAGQFEGRIARYARGKDYHRVLAARARPLLRLLGESDPGSRSRFFVDHGPLLERAVARLSGIGWQGKNAMVLVPGVGSWTLLAAIVTTVALPPDRAESRSCGACTRCLPSCPTGAIRAPGHVVSDLCISYHTIENRGVIPREIRPAIGDWVFGCDLCQEVCPVNRDAPPASIASLAARPGSGRVDLLELLDLDEAGFHHRFAGMPVRRARWEGFLRNVCVALGNVGDARAVPALTKAFDRSPSLVRGHAAWALGRLGAVDVLRELRGRERDPAVLEEIDAALAVR